MLEILLLVRGAPLNPVPRILVAEMPSASPEAVLLSVGAPEALLETLTPLAELILVVIIPVVSVTKQAKESLFINTVTNMS